MAWVNSGTVAYSHVVGWLISRAYRQRRRPFWLACTGGDHTERRQQRRLAIAIVEGPSAFRDRQRRYRQVDGCRRAGADARVRWAQGLARRSRRAPRDCATLRCAAAALQRAQDRDGRTRWPGQRAGDRHRGRVPGIPRHVLQPRHRRPGDAAHRGDRVRDDDRAGSARRLAHRQDQGIRDPRRQRTNCRSTTRSSSTRRRPAVSYASWTSPGRCPISPRAARCTRRPRVW